MENQPQAAPSGSKSTIWIIILVVVLIVAGGAYFFLAQDDGTNTNSTNNANAGVNSVGNANENTNAAANANANQATNENFNAVTNTNAITQTNELVYVNSQFGFTLEFPTDWTGYTVETYVNSDQSGQPQVYSTVAFEHPRHESSDNQPGKVGFSIFVFENPDTPVPSGITLLSGASSSRFGWTRGNAALPGDLYQLDQEIDGIIASFKTQ